MSNRRVITITVLVVATLLIVIIRSRSEDPKSAPFKGAQTVQREGPKKETRAQEIDKPIVTEPFEEPTAKPAPTGWRGRLIDGLSRPINGTSVLIWPELVPYSTYFIAPWSAKGSTDAQGAFEIQLDEKVTEMELPASVTMTAQHQVSGKTDALLRDEVPLKKGTMLDLGDCVAGKDGARITGAVKLKDGAPVEGAQVYVVFPTGRVNGVKVSTDRFGDFELNGVQWSRGSAAQQQFRMYICNLGVLFPGKIVTPEPSKHWIPVSGGRAEFTLTVEDPAAPVNRVVLKYKGPQRKATVRLEHKGADSEKDHALPIVLIEGEVPIPFGTTLARAETEKFVLILTCADPDAVGERRVTLSLTFENGTPILFGYFNGW